MQDIFFSQGIPRPTNLNYMYLYLKEASILINGKRRNTEPKIFGNPGPFVRLSIFKNSLGE